MKPHHRVMIVDDDSTNISVLRTLLEPSFTVQISKSGKHAIMLASHTKPDLILLDILMPDVDGYTVCQSLKTDENTKHIPVIFITSKCSNHDEAKGLSLGAIDYITKPFRPDIVKARVNAHLALKLYQEQLVKREQESALILSETNKALEKKSHDLYKTDIALNVILEKTERNEQSLREKLLYKLQGQLSPYLDKLENENNPAARRAAINSIKQTINILSNTSSLDKQTIQQKLSPTEIKIANWIKQGKSTKEISKLTKLVEKTVYWHRNNIREKLGLSNQKQSLRSFLISIDEK